MKKEFAFRFATLSAVSTDEQVEKKASLDDQARAARPEAFRTNEYTDKRKTLLAQLDKLKDDEYQTAEQLRRQAEREQVVRSMSDLLPHIHDWIARYDPPRVKFHLSRVVRLTVHPDKRITADLLD